MQMKELQQQAENAKMQLKYGQITLEEAKERAMPFIQEANKKAKEIAKEFKMSPRLLNVSSFLR